MLELLPSRLREARLAAHMTQAAIASKVGVNPPAISSYESGNRRPSYEVLVKMAIIYKKSTDYLLGLTPNEQANSSLDEKEKELFREFVRLVKEQNRES